MSPADPRIIREPISRADLGVLAQARFGDMVKAVVDISRGIIAAGGELHSDEEALLIEDGSQLGDLWGINLYPNETGPEWLEFDSMINVRPSQGNRSRDVEDPSTREAIDEVLRRLGARRMTSTTPATAHNAERWATLSLAAQMGNVGSEVQRAIRAHASGRADRFDSALARALELFDLTATDARWRGRRRREILRAREEFCRIFFDPSVSPASADGLNKYFMAFATAARK